MMTSARVSNGVKLRPSGRWMDGVALEVITQHPPYWPSSAGTNRPSSGFECRDRLPRAPVLLFGQLSLLLSPGEILLRLTQRLLCLVAPALGRRQRPPGAVGRSLGCGLVGTGRFDRLNSLAIDP